MNTKIRNGAIALLLAGAIAGSTSACTISNGTNNKANSMERNADQQSLQQLEQADPIPTFSSSQLRKNVADIEVLQANSTQTTSFFMMMGDPNPIYSCTSIGLPIPVTDQLTNPNQVLRQGFGNGNYGDGVVGQIDPTGVYSGQSSGTNVVCVDSAGKPYISYWEGDVLSFSYGATWNYTTHSVSLIGGPTAKVHSK